MGTPSKGGGRGPGTGSIAVDIPPFWHTTAVGNGCTLSSCDNCHCLTEWCVMAILTSPTDGRTDEQAYDRRWWTLAVLCLSLLIVFGGNSTLNVALPTLSRDLGATESQLQWVVAVYSLVFAGLLFTSGAIGDRFGRKGALQFGLA